MSDDAALLRRYVEERVPGALAELVRRHLDMVYALAWRHADGNAPLAEEITQNVFCRLAREAPVHPPPHLAGWFYAATRISADRFRPAGTLGSGAADGGWNSICDAAFDELSEDDRVALLLHFFSERPPAEIGQALELSVEAAELRVRRALDQFRAGLANRGTRLGIAALDVLLHAQAGPPAPSGLAERLVEALAEVSAAPALAEPGPPLSTSVVRFFNSGTALGAVAMLVLGGMLTWGYRTNHRLENENTRLRGEVQELSGLQRDNRRLARLIAEAQNLKREVADLPTLRATVFPPANSPPAGTLALTVMPNGAIRWENEDISPAEFIRRLQDSRAEYSATGSSVIVHADGLPLSAVTYLLDEVRKARITVVLVEGEPLADGGNAGWF